MMKALVKSGPSRLPFHPGLCETTSISHRHSDTVLEINSKLDRLDCQRRTSGF
jgi:hypothetical protein